MSTFLYAPGIRVYIKTAKHGLLDISDDLSSGTMVRRSDGISTFDFAMNNTQRMYDGVFTPNDRIVVVMKRISWMRTFTGLLTSVPLMSIWPRDVNIRASCSLKRLQYWYWDPNAAQSFQMLSDALSKEVPGVGPNAINDGGITNVVLTILKEVAQWPEEKVHISRIPDTWYDAALKLAKEVAQQASDADAAAIDYMNSLGANGSVGSGTGSGITYNGDAPVMINGKLQPGNYGGETLDASQVGFAQTIYAVGKGMSMSDRDCLLALMCARQESVLRNLSGGDRDSVGLFQQRPSMGWGTVSQIMNPEYAARKFYSVLKTITNRDSMKETAAIQAVQRSGFPDAYQAWLPMAQALMKSLTSMQKTDAPPSITTNHQKMLKDVTDPDSSLSSSSSTTAATGSGIQARPKGTGSGPGGSTPWYGLPPGEFYEYYRPEMRPVLIAFGKWAQSKGWTVLEHPQFEAVSRVHYESGGRLLSLHYTPQGDAMDISRGGMFGGSMSPAGDPGDQLAEEALRWGLACKWKIAPGDHTNHVHVDTSILTNLYGRGLQKLPGYRPGETPPTTINTSGAGAVDFGSGGGVTGDVATQPAVQLQSFSDSSYYNASDPFAKLFGDSPWNPEPDTAQQAFSESLTGVRALMNDQPLLVYIKNLFYSTLRSFSSAPNGDLIAWFPDYYGLWGTAAKMVIEPIELKDFTVDWSDDSLVTHMFTVAGQYGTTGLDLSSGSIGSTGIFTDPSYGDMRTVTRGIATIDMQALMFCMFGIEATPEQGKKFADFIYQRFGARPEYEEMPGLQGPHAEFFSALYKFMFYWSYQYNADIQMTFMPEIWPGMIVQIPEYNFQAYVTTVTHSFSFGEGGGFNTTVNICAPAKMDDTHGVLLGMLEAGDYAGMTTSGPSNAAPSD